MKMTTRTMLTRVVLVAGLVLTGDVAAGQSWESAERWGAFPARAGCADGQCRLGSGLPDLPVRVERQVAPALDASAEEMIARACGYVRLKAATDDGGVRWGSAVCVGRGPGVDEWVFLTAGHIFAGAGRSTSVQLDVRGVWRDARVVASDRLPDRAVLLMTAREKLRSPIVSQADETSGAGVMVGFPGGGAARAFVGRTSASAERMGWLTLVRASHFDCINGASGGGVYDAAGALIGIQSCTDGRGAVREVGFTPVGAWDEVFARLGWRPSGWERDGESLPDEVPIEQAGRSNDVNNKCDGMMMKEEMLFSRLRQVDEQLEELRKFVKAIPRGPKGERGAQGERGPRGERGPAGPAGEAGPRVSEADVARAVAKYLAAHPVERVDVGRLEERLRAIEERMDVPFEVQLFDSGKKAGGSRFVRPHGGYLPLDVFGDVENVAGQERGE